MKALTIWQPWAALIVVGAKPVENRTWKSGLRVGERFAIHAGKDCDVEEWVIKEIEALGPDKARSVCWDNGYIIGTVRLAGIITRAEQLPPPQRKWFRGPVGWWVADPRPWRAPLKIKGALGLWEIPSVVDQVSDEPTVAE